MKDPENNELLALKTTQQAYICDIDEIKNHNSKIKYAYTNKYHVRPLIVLHMMMNPNDIN